MRKNDDDRDADVDSFTQHQEEYHQPKVVENDRYRCAHILKQGKDNQRNVVRLKISGNLVTIFFLGNLSPKENTRIEFRFLFSLVRDHFLSTIIIACCCN